MSLTKNLATHIIKNEAAYPYAIELLTKYNMLSLLPSLRDALTQLSKNDVLFDTLVIEAPFELSQDAIIKIKRIVGDEHVPHQVTINKEVLAGFRARLRGKLYDGSAQRIVKQLIGSNH